MDGWLVRFIVFFEDAKCLSEHSVGTKRREKQSLRRTKGNIVFVRSFVELHKMKKNEKRLVERKRPMRSVVVQHVVRWGRIPAVMEIRRLALFTSLLLSSRLFVTNPCRWQQLANTPSMLWSPLVSLCSSLRFTFVLCSLASSLVVVEQCGDIHGQSTQCSSDQIGSIRCSTTNSTSARKCQCNVFPLRSSLDG